MNKFQLGVQIARFVIFLFFAVKDLVLKAEEEMPEPGRGSEKFQAVKEGITIAAKYVGIAREAVDAVDDFVDEKINSVVASEINGA